MTKQRKSSKQLKGGPHLYCCGRWLGNGAKSLSPRLLRQLGIKRRPNNRRWETES